MCPVGVLLCFGDALFSCHGFVEVNIHVACNKLVTHDGGPWCSILAQAPGQHPTTLEFLFQGVAKEGRVAWWVIGPWTWRQCG